MIRKEKKKNRKDKLQKIKEQGGPSCKLFWSDLRRKKKSRRITRMRGNDEAVVEETEQVLEVLAKHWEELGKSRNSLSPEQEPELVHESSDMCQEIGWEEVVKVLKMLKRGKAPGPDGILNEMLIYGGSRIVETLRCMFNVMRRSQVYPQDWKSSFVIPLFKDGDPESASNYRGIALGSCVAKVWARILTVRLGEYAEENILTDAQGGFRAKRRCADQIMILRGVCELRKRKKKSTWLGFMDVSKAYDTVWREGLWKKMREYGVEESFVRLCKGLYEGVQASVQVDGQQSRWFRVEEGLRQGCPLSPLLYSIYIMGMVEELERESLGVKVSGVWCGALLYADDIVLIAETGEELQKMLDMVGRYAEVWKFRFNARKSKVMVVGKKNGGEKWRIGDEEMEEVDSFKYLGVWFDQRMRGNVQLEKMVEQAEEWAGKIEWMARVDGELEAERGRLLWDLVARPGLEHAAEVWWPGGKTAGKRLEAVQDRLGRRLLGASRTVAGEAIRGEMGWRKLEERREEKKMLYGRRFWELGEERLVKLIVEKLKESGSIGWREEYEVLLRKYGLEEDEEEESGSAAAWKKKIEKQNWESWQEEVDKKSSLKWYKKVKEENGPEKYVGSWESHVAVRLRFRLRSGSAGLFEDKTRCQMMQEDRCVLCNGGNVENVKHFVLECEEFDQDRCRLLERIKRIVGAEEWVKEYEEGDDDSRVCLLLGRRVDVDREVMDVIDRCIMKEMVMWWQRRKVLLGWVN